MLSLLWEVDGLLVFEELEWSCFLSFEGGREGRKRDGGGVLMLVGQPRGGGHQINEVLSCLPLSVPPFGYKRKQLHKHDLEKRQWEVKRS